MAKFLTITCLRPQVGELANRDDTGSAKTLIYGGVSRTRVSSQSTKFHLSHSTSPYTLASEHTPDGLRSRNIFAYIAEKVKAQGVSEETSLWMAGWVKSKMMKKAADRSKKPEETPEEKEAGPKRGRKGGPQKESNGAVTAENLETDQLIFLGHPEIDYLVTNLVGSAKKHRNDRTAIEADLLTRFNVDTKRSSLVAMAAGSGIRTALFGRFITSDWLAHTAAPVHVAHAFTVHAAEPVDDYFTAVDDLGAEGEGAGHLNTTELTSGLLLYSIVIDVELLIKNLSDDAKIAADEVRRLIMLLATESMSAKQGSTAPHSRAEFLMVEAGNAQPRILAAAFDAPIKNQNDEGWLEPTIKRLASYLEREARMYDDDIIRFCASMAVTRLPNATQCSLVNVSKLAGQAVLSKLTAEAVRACALKAPKETVS